MLNVLFSALLSGLGHSLTRLIALFFIASASLWAQTPIPGLTVGSTASAVVQTEQVKAELLVHAPQGWAAGSRVWAGLRLTHQPHWHTYWQNPGDSGLPTQLSWQLPEGIEAGEVAWPVPQRLAVGSLINHGYEGKVLLAAPLTIQRAPTQTFDLRLKASWLVCRQECIPQDGEFVLKVSPQASSSQAMIFEQARQSLPTPLPDTTAQLQGQQISLRLTQLPRAWQGQPLWAASETSDITPASAPMNGRWEGDVWHITLPLSDLRSTAPTQLSWLIAPVASAATGASTGASTPAGVRVTTRVMGAWPDLPKAATVSPALQAALDASQQQAQEAPATSTTPATYLLALLGALVGGLILNLMPCVFPVLAIKVLGFTQHAQDRDAHRRSGLAYTAGVVCSFLALGGLLLALRAAGNQLGWGFQLQNPWVVSALTVLLTLLALNLMGLFEFSQWAPSGLASFQAKHPVVDAFLSGVLAVLVASPCTAPFMGASLGLAVTLPDAQALTIFAAMGLGLALPYLLASWLPAVAQALPRPGPWMAHLRHVLAFPMLLTVVWLLWVLGLQAGADAQALLLCVLVVLAAVIWAWHAGGRIRYWLAPFLIASLALLMWLFHGFLLESQQQHLTHADTNTDSHPSTGQRATGTVASNGSATQAAWQSWSPEVVAQARAQGRTVFVDFTAAWCVTCQVNKKTTLSDASLLADFSSQNVLLLRADWTRQDPMITRALNALGRSGVPVYVVYRGAEPPRVLSELISVNEVRQALKGS